MPFENSIYLNSSIQKCSSWYVNIVPSWLKKVSVVDNSRYRCFCALSHVDLERKKYLSHYFFLRNVVKMLFKMYNESFITLKRNGRSYLYSPHGSLFLSQLFCSNRHNKTFPQLMTRSISPSIPLNTSLTVFFHFFSFDPMKIQDKFHDADHTFAMSLVGCSSWWPLK